MDTIATDNVQKVDTQTQVAGQNQEVKQTETQQETQHQEIKQDEIKSSPITEEAFKMFKESYDKQLETFKKELKGRDQKITELQKTVMESKTKELTEEQKRELEKQKIKDEYHNLFIQQTIAEFNLKQYDQDMDFTGFFYTNTEDPEEMREEIKGKGKTLNDYITKAIKTGIEKGVNERLATGAYIPKSSVSANPNDLKSMTKDQLIEKTNEVTKLPASLEKTKMLEDLFSEQMRRMKG